LPATTGGELHVTGVVVQPVAGSHAAVEHWSGAVHVTSLSTQPLPSTHAAVLHLFVVVHVTGVVVQPPFDGSHTPVAQSVDGHEIAVCLHV
jgi:hypothetical protein